MFNVKRRWKRLLVLRPAAALRRAEHLAATGKPQKAFRLMSWLARHHIPAAQLGLARAYLEGVHVPKSRQDAILWCEKAACDGLVDAQSLLAALHLSGPARSSSYELFSTQTSDPVPALDLAFHWATLAGAGGSADAKAILAHLHAHGPEAQRSLERSEMFYRESAEQGSAKGAFGYAMILLQQPVDSPTRDRATCWLRKAADAELPLANYVYGYTCEHGIGRSVDLVEAATFYKRSAQRGVLQGQLRWGMLLIQGKHVPQNTVEGESWLRKAALAGEPDAASAVGDLYTCGPELPPNFLEAANWYRRAAEQSHVLASFKLAQLLQHDRPSLPQDLDGAIGWYCFAAEHGHQPARTELTKLLHARAPEVQQARVRSWFENKAQAGDHNAALNLGLSFLSRFHDMQANEQAVSWLRQAADTIPEAQYLYGFLLVEGRGLSADLHAGRRWIKCAADKGVQDAQVLLAEMMLNGRGGPRDEAAAFGLFKQAAENGHPGAAFALGVMLRGGYGMIPNQADAFLWLKEAARLGHAGARELVET